MTTSTSIEATCSPACPFRDAGCYEQAGFARFSAASLDRAALGMSAEQVIAQEVTLLDAAFKGKRVPRDGARGGRDLRLHVGGDVGSVRGARLIAGAASRWRHRGGSTVWTYTHLWREIPRRAWGPDLTVLASVERPEDIEAARAQGYPAALVVERFASRKAFRLPGTSARIVPCPAETADTTAVTCATCRLCLDRDLLALDVAIAFELHGHGRSQARNALVELRRKSASGE